VPALDELCDEFPARFGLTVTFRDDDQDKPLSPAMSILLFRSVRELLLNVARHSGATSARVSLKRVEDEIRVMVEDEGSGFDPAEAAARARRGECFGLFSLAERLGNSGGRFEVDSAPAQGARITMVAPIYRTDDLSFDPLPNP
jgi:signal transduction histidine kinase